MNEGNKNGMWKGGRTISTGGYVYVRAVGHPRVCGKGHYVFEHILILEKKLGRYLKPGEQTHHKNGIKYDNRLSNLELVTPKEHFLRHGKPKGFGFKPEYKATLEHRDKVSKAKKEYWRLWRLKKKQSK